MFTLLRVWQSLNPLRLQAGRRDGGAPLPLPGVSVSTGFKFPCRFRVRFPPKLDSCNGFYHTLNPDHWQWATFTTKTRHFNFTILGPIKYLSSDCIVTWSMRRLCRFSRSCPSRIQICDRTNCRWVAIKNPRISPKFFFCFAGTQQISVQLQIGVWEVKAPLKLHNQRTDHATIRSELINLYRAEVLPK